MSQRRDASPPLLPPRLRDWTRGTYQVGVFVRGPAGNVYEMVTTKPATREIVAHAVAALRGDKIDVESLAATARKVDADLAAAKKVRK